MRPAATSSADPAAGRFRLPDGSRSVQSPWVWRGFLFMSLIALGLGITLVTGRQLLYAAAWAVIAIGWLAIAMWLWRQHLRYHDAVDRADRNGRRP